MKRFWIGFLCMIAVGGINAQHDHIDVLKGLSGNELYNQLVENYKPNFTMTYGMSRDTLYSKIDVLPGNKLAGIYSGFQITLDPNLDPTQDAFDKGINAEHTYPQSKGASEGFARSDMHHLRPCRVNVNSDRGSLPYAESPDNQTDQWYRGGQQTSNIPTSSIDQYSELNNGIAFEPRESIKGDIARGIFYFYTMYRQEAMNADPNFFDLQKDVLCEWHYADPVDEREWLRNEQIAFYQDGKVNPFIYDCSLVSRLYCDQISEMCSDLTPVKEDFFEEDVIVSALYPNPTQASTTIDIYSPVRDQYTVTTLDLKGNSIAKTSVLVGAGVTQKVVIDQNSRGIFYIEIVSNKGFRSYHKLVKL